jgi:predicted Zn-dependent protease with MMP-like domain
VTAADLIAPSLDDFEALARRAWLDLPAELRATAGEVIFRIEDFATEDVLDELGIEDPFSLTGLYRGTDLTQAAMTAPAPHQPMVFLYRRPILDEWVEHGEVTLYELISHVLVHEVGHHFGLSDEAIDALLAQAD